MKYCFYCGKEVTQDSAYCPHCGSALQKEPSPAANQAPGNCQSVHQTPVYNYQQPTAQARPAVSAGSKVKGYIGMGFSILSLAFGILSLVASLLSFDTAMDSYFIAERLAKPIAFGILAIIPAIPAKVLSSHATSEGFVEKPTRLGRIFSTIGIILGAVGFGMGILCVFIALS